MYDCYALKNREEDSVISETAMHLVNPTVVNNALSLAHDELLTVREINEDEFKEALPHIRSFVANLDRQQLVLLLNLGSISAQSTIGAHCPTTTSSRLASGMNSGLRFAPWAWSTPSLSSHLKQWERSLLSGTMKKCNDC
jgi:hypothetical protein